MFRYYSDDPGKVGHTFLRLERDFENYVYFLRELPNTVKLINENKVISDYLQVRFFIVSTIFPSNKHNLAIYINVFSH